MSFINRRKHVLKERMQDDFALPTETQQVVRLAFCRGNNLHMVEAADPDVADFLVTMAKKFRNTIFVKRGDFLLVEAIEECVKVKAEIVKILMPEHVKEFTNACVWPKRFLKKHKPDSEDEDDEEEFMVRNKNWQVALWPQHADDDTNSDEESHEESGEESGNDESIWSSTSEEDD